MKIHRAIAILLFSLSSFLTPVLAADPPNKEASATEPVFSKLLPESLDDLRAIQTQTKKVLERVLPCTVGVRIGGASGSGVIVSKDGFVLTAGHVSGEPGQRCKIILQTGEVIDGKSLGRNARIDSGMFQITSKGEWPFVEMGSSAELKAGQWCIAAGHPNGYEKGRSPVVRVGRILSQSRTEVSTDCCLVGGDSGGPLFDLEGKVIAIHSRIGGSISSNVHVPIDTYRDSWDRLVKGEQIGPNSAVTAAAWLGVRPDDDSKDCKLGGVTEESPAEKAGLLKGDVITKFDGKDIKSYDEMVAVLAKKKPGDEVEIIVKRGSATRIVKVKLEKKGG